MTLDARLAFARMAFAFALAAEAGWLVFLAWLAWRAT